MKRALVRRTRFTRRWAKRGTRPSAPRDQRTASTYIFGAICPKQGKAAALILPFCNTEAMNLHLAEIAKAVAAQCRPPRRSSRMASVSKIARSRQHHHYPAAAEMP